MQYLIVILLALIVLLFAVNIFEKRVQKIDEMALALLLKTVKSPLYVILAILIASVLLLSGYREDILMQFGTSGSAYVYSANFTKTPVSKSGYCDRLIVKYKIDIENASVAYGTDNLDGCFEDNSKRLKVGDKIQVLYLKSLPAYNSVVKPVGIINNDRLIQLIVGVFILLSLLAILMLRNKKLKENEVVYTIYSVSFLVGVVSMLYGIADILCWFLI